MDHGTALNAALFAGYVVPTAGLSYWWGTLGVWAAAVLLAAAHTVLCATLLSVVSDARHAGAGSDVLRLSALVTRLFQRVRVGQVILALHLTVAACHPVALIFVWALVAYEVRIMVVSPHFRRADPATFVLSLPKHQQAAFFAVVCGAVCLVYSLVHLVLELLVPAAGRLIHHILDR